MFKTKKAQGIPMETVIIAIIVLVVLVVIIAFFVGGTSTVVQKVKQLFGGAIAGEDRQQAITFCQQYCDKLVSSGKNPGDAADPYCGKSFYIDTLGSGSADRVGNDPKKPYIKYTCFEPSSVKISGEETKSSLGVSCSIPCSAA